MSRCQHCGLNLKKNTKFCPECGTIIIWEDDSKTSDGKTGKTKLVAIMITLLLIAAVVTFFVLGEANWFKIIMSQPAFSEDPAAISAASQSVVKLNCYDKSGELYATGSGFACFADNVIVTNYHVIEGGVYSIEASTEEGRTFDITYVFATDEEKDIAILGASSPHNLALLKPGDSDDLQKGEKVVAIGSPLGLLNSVSTGVFSGYVKENNMNVLQFTASISSGSSGGALFNDVGEVFGITFASYEAGQNLNLAVPINEVAELLSKVTSKPELLTDIYWKNNLDEFYLHTYGEPIEVTIIQLKQSPEKYMGKMIALNGFVSSIDLIGESKRMGLYLSNQKNTTKDVYSDSKRCLNEPFSEHPFVDITTYKLFSDPFDLGISDSIPIHIGDHIVVIGVFEKNASGFYHVEAGKVEFLS